MAVFWLEEEQKGSGAAFISAPAVTRLHGAFYTIIKLCSVRNPPPHHSFSVTQFVFPPPRDTVLKMAPGPKIKENVEKLIWYRQFCCVVVLKKRELAPTS